MGGFGWTRCRRRSRQPTWCGCGYGRAIFGGWCLCAVLDGRWAFRCGRGKGSASRVDISRFRNCWSRSRRGVIGGSRLRSCRSGLLLNSWRSFPHLDNPICARIHECVFEYRSGCRGFTSQQPSRRCSDSMRQSIRRVRSTPIGWLTNDGSTRKSSSGSGQSSPRGESRWRTG